MAKMGRPKTDTPLDQRVTVRFEQKEYDLLLEYAKTQNLTVTQAIRLCVEREILTKQK